MKRVIAGLLFILLAGSLLFPSFAQARPAHPDLEQTVDQAESGVVATVKVNRLNVRRIPRTTGSILGQLRLNEQVALLGRTRVADWLEAQTPFGVGWIDARYVSTNVNITLLPVTEFSILPFATVTTAPRVIVRSGPFKEYPVVMYAPIGTELDVIGLHSKNTHVQVITPYGIGWVQLDQVRVLGDVSLLPVTDRDVKPLAQIYSYRVHVRAAPSIAASIVATVRLGQYYAILQEDATRLWYQIRGPFGTGWILGRYVKLIGYPLRYE